MLDEFDSQPEVVVHLALLSRIGIVPGWRMRDQLGHFAAAIKGIAHLQCLKTVTEVISNVLDRDLCQRGWPRDRSAQRKHTKMAHPPATDQPIVWGVQLIPFSSKKVVCSMAAVFSAGHSGRDMGED